MKLDLSNAPEGMKERPPEVGLVYATTKGTFNIIVAIRGSTAYTLVFSNDGEIVGSSQYSTRTYFGSKIPVGHVDDLPELLSITWYGE